MRREPRGSHHHLDDLAYSTALDASYSLASVALAASAALDELASPSGIARAAPSLPLPRVGPPSDEFASRISASDPAPCHWPPPRPRPPRYPLPRRRPPPPRSAPALSISTRR
ncbi:Os08g0265350 [Oryza sativa Japonica Group]|uniref:Os08g0265350 protein n=1 Tax=Oryza sativa subsp. japonica TaxID=39947 RepID=A0A0P0XDV8_ORYSJ|nr:hypothetical protein DAI22_08g093100 [Oryza sativa Japonica Group]BAT04617.1 Os08g0265350 [Oryza sativa Japonica Group]